MPLLTHPAAVLLRVTSALQYFQFKNIPACVASGISGGVLAVPPARKYPGNKNPAGYVGPVKMYGNRIAD